VVFSNDGEAEGRKWASLTSPPLCGTKTNGGLANEESQTAEVVLWNIGRLDQSVIA